MKKLTNQDFKKMPWKNGGGVTTELYRIGESDNFNFRLSVASVETSGPFSIFPNIDRTILLLAGNGITLHSQSFTHSLTTPLTPFHFSGDLSVTGVLVDGSITDFNVMTKRDELISEVSAQLLTDFKAKSLTFLYSILEQALYVLEKEDCIQCEPQKFIVITVTNRATIS